MAERNIGTLLLVALMIVALIIELVKLRNMPFIQLLFVVILILLGLLTLFGLPSGSTWAVQLAALFFTLQLLNVVVLYVKFSAYPLGLALLMLLSIAGFLMAVGQIHSAPERPVVRQQKLPQYLQQQSYHTEITKPEVVVAEKPTKRASQRTKRKPGRPRKTAKR
ncbi:hypothetical protein HYW21_00820 [Candidatus Woesearchaeota archaeon]|nr:hypothetical protein [Candidatus Woesearchaeota archaeon]